MKITRHRNVSGFVVSDDHKRGETLCARYSWKLNGFGYAKPHCLWSDTRQAIPLEDMKSAYYGYSVIESRVWVSGVGG